MLFVHAMEDCCSYLTPLLFVGDGNRVPDSQLNSNGIFYSMRAEGDIIAAVVGQVV